MSFPGAFGNAFGAEQNFRNHAIRAAVQPRVQRTERERQSLSALRRELVERWARWTAVERAPKPASGIRACVEIVVKRQFDDVSCAGQRLLLQPKTMLGSAELQHGMPSVRCPPDLARRQRGQVEVDRRAFRRRLRLGNRNDGRKDFRRPKDCLFVKGPLRVSSESRGPISS